MTRGRVVGVGRALLLVLVIAVLTTLAFHRWLGDPSHWMPPAGARLVRSGDGPGA
jgi:hypothetical protein